MRFTKANGRVLYTVGLSQHLGLSQPPAQSAAGTAAAHYCNTAMGALSDL